VSSVVGIERSFHGKSFGWTGTGVEYVDDEWVGHLLCHLRDLGLHVRRSGRILWCNRGQWNVHCQSGPSRILLNQTEMKSPMTKRQFERERARQARQKVLQLLEASRAAADPEYPVRAAGFWLRAYPGVPDPSRNFRLREPDALPVYFGA
jgi:hypothetical protein